MGAHGEQHTPELEDGRLLLQVQHVHAGRVSHVEHRQPVGDRVRALPRHRAHLAQQAQPKRRHPSHSPHLGVLHTRRHAHLHVPQTVRARVEEPRRNMVTNPLCSNLENTITA